MKKTIVGAVLAVMVASTSGCADHPYLTAGAAALAAGAAATMYAKNTNKKHDDNDQRRNEDEARRWDREHQNNGRFQRRDRYEDRGVDCEHLSYDAPNFQRRQCGY